MDTAKSSQHSVNSTLVNMSGDTERPRGKTVILVKTACGEPPWREKEERNALLGPVSLSPMGQHQSTGDAWGEKKLNY